MLPSPCTPRFDGCPSLRPLPPLTPLDVAQGFEEKEKELHALKCLAVESEQGADGCDGAMGSLGIRLRAIHGDVQGISTPQAKELVCKFVEVVGPEGKAFATRCARMKVWSELFCALWDSSSVAKMLLLTISTKSYELGSLDCLEQLIVHERTITRWIPPPCREQQDKLCREETIGQAKTKILQRSIKHRITEHTSVGVV
ncbi:tRNA-splicing endonuclease subunit Sen2-2 [Zea mays]|uniref:tRNA-splicing endonuclease subunit Sen2-2 n=1 Tax=Zea mays TaxID=4577 RepID=A0A1D6K7N9_MAIZE|nr:tRNA-splicing endonuclease subunit Sen2-2 [Zea mays]